MTKKDKELFEEDEHVNVNFEQMIYEIVIFAAVFLLLFMIMSIASKAQEPVYVTYQQAGCNLTKYLLMNVKADRIAKENYKEQETLRTIVDEFNKRQAEKRQHDESVNKLAHLISNEVGILGEDAMYIAGSVVLNRVEDNDFSDSINGVIYQRNPIQYACAWNGMLEREPLPVAYEIAEDLITNGTTVPVNVVYQAQFQQGHGVYRKIGNTYFCYK